MSEKNYFEPVQFYTVSKKESPPPPGTEYCPVVFDHEIQKHSFGNEITYLDATCTPCMDSSQATYIVHPQHLSAPAGFSHFCGEAPAPLDMWSMQTPSLAHNLYTPRMVEAPPEKKDEVETPEKLSIEVGKDGFYVFSSKNHKRTRATNFVITPVSITEYLRLWQEESTRTIDVRVDIFAEGQSTCHPLKVPYEELKSILALVSKKIAVTIIYAEHSGTMSSKFPEYIRTKLASAQTTTVCQSSGWHVMKNGVYQYVHNNAKVLCPDTLFDCGFSFGYPTMPLSPQDALANVWHLLDMATPKVNILVPVLYAHLGCLWEVFSMAGYPPHVLLYVQGISGSLKTAVTSMLFNFSALPEHNIPATFRDTSASMEVKMGKYKDRVLLVDDFCPSATSASKKQMEQLLEQLVRFYGDGIGKARTNPKLEETFEKKPRGLCVITGENISGSYSSQLRCLFLELEKECYNKEILAEFQLDPTQWTGHLYHFVAACQHNVEDMVLFIQHEFPAYRKRGEEAIQERRLIDTYAWLSITARLFVNYVGSVTPALSSSALDHLHADMDADILAICQRSEKVAVESNPAKTFSSILMNAIRRDEVRIGTVAEAEANIKEFMGVEYQGYWHLWPTPTYQLILDTYRKEGRTFPLSKQALWQVLANAGLLIPAVQKSKGPNRREYSTRFSHLGRPYLLKIDPKVLEVLENG